MVPSDAATELTAIEGLAHQIFMPLVLLVNYTFFQYLVVFYWPRRNERRVRALFFTAATSALCLIPFATTDVALARHLNDASESCCVLTFLLQITIVGYDLNKKIKFRTIHLLTRMAEWLTAVEIFVTILSITCAFCPGFIDPATEELIPTINDNFTQLFLFMFRVYCLAASYGWRGMIQSRKAELFWYFCFTTHEVPFLVLDSVTGFSWEFVQALWERTTLAGCLYVTARSKLRTKTSQRTMSKYDVPSIPRKRASGSVVVSKSSSKARISVSQVAISSRTASMESMKPFSPLD